MGSKKKISISWSGGKDAALSLYKIFQLNTIEVVNLHTVISEKTRRVGMHGIREELIDLQADAIGVPLQKLYLSEDESHESYQRLMLDHFTRCRDEGVQAIMFGDIFLEDLKAYRDSLLQNANLQGVYPIWKSDSKTLLKEFLAAGFKTMICACNQACYDAGLLGQTIGAALPDLLPSEVDVCGENGEFHTFVYHAPFFRQPIPFETGDEVKKTYTYHVTRDDGVTEKKETNFWFQEVLPVAM